MEAITRPRQTAQVSSKLRATKAKQRGWDIVAQARQDAKHQPRHQQRTAARQAAHHHRQRHNIDNYAKSHASQLELQLDENSQSRNQRNVVSSRLFARNLLRSRSLKKLGLAGASVASLALIVGAGVVFTGQMDATSQSVQTGQVQSVTTQTAPTASPPAPIEPAQTVETETQSATDAEGDGNIGLWSSSLDE